MSGKGFSLYFPLFSGNALDILLHPVRAVPAHLLCDMTIDVQSERCGCVAEVGLHCLYIVPALDGGNGICVPIGYNCDNTEKSSNFKGFGGFCFSLFHGQAPPARRRRRSAPGRRTGSAGGSVLYLWYSFFT